MRVTASDLRRNLKKVLDAVERNETVILSRRGREIALIVPTSAVRPSVAIRDLPAFGIWKDRTDMADPGGYVRQLRKGRFSGA